MNDRSCGTLIKNVVLRLYLGDWDLNMSHWTENNKMYSHKVVLRIVLQNDI